MKRKCIVSAIGVIFSLSARAGFFDCESETSVNVYNKAPFTENDAINGHWTKMTDYQSFYHIEGKWTEVVEKVAQKEAILLVVQSITGQNLSESARQELSNALDSSLNINHKYISPDGHNEAVFDTKGQLVNNGPLQGTYNKDVPTGDWVDRIKHGISSIGPHIDCVLHGDYEWDPTSKCFVIRQGEEVNVDCETGAVVSQPKQVPSPDSEEAGLNFDSNTPVLNKDVLHSLADLLETGEEIVEIREDMREDRRERKAREQAERERKAAEDAERLRQQQLAEQRKKKDSQKKDSDKKQDVKKETKKEKPKKDTPTPAPATADIDFSKLNSLISQQASFLRGIISSGQKATSAQHAKFNSLNNQYASEFNRLKAQIGNISDPAKRSQYYSKLASINSRMNSEVDPLLAQGASRGLFTNL